MAKQILYAIWRHDQFPYVLGGRVEEILPEGTVRIKGMGDRWIRPLRLLPYQDGLNLITRISKIAGDYRQQTAELHDTAKFKVDQILAL